MARQGKAQRRGHRRRRITPEDLTRFVHVADPQISPDGERVVFAHKRVGERNEYVESLWLVPAAGGAPRPFTAGGRDRHPRWSPDGTRIAFLCGREPGHPQIHWLPADGGESRPLTALPEGAIGTFKWSPDGTRIALSFRPAAPAATAAAAKEREAQGLSDPPRVLDSWWYRYDGDGYFDGQRHALYLVDVESGEAKRLYAEDTLGLFSFDFAPDGRQLVVGTNRDRRAWLGPWHDDLVRVRIADGRVTPIPVPQRGEKGAVAWSPDGRWIAYAGRVGQDNAFSPENLELWVCDPVTGRARSLTGRTDYCLQAPPLSDTAEASFAPVFRWSPDARRLYAQVGWHGESHIAAVGLRGGLTFLTRGRTVHQLGNLSADGRRMALTAGTATRLDEVHLGQLQGDGIATRRLTDLNGPLRRQLQLSTPTSHWVTAPDGTRVHTWVLRPPGRGGRRRQPAVLEVHGGPHAQYGVGFFHELQVLAAAGYAVFYSNPRGSKGYGRDHCAAIRGAWGGVDWVDVQAVTAFIRGQPGVDPERIGIIGGSYGGYMTNWAIGHSRAYRAAISDRCVSNLVSMSGTSDHPLPPDRYFPGNAWDRAEERWRQSPLRYAGQVRTPTLLIHSEGDLRCNIEQGEEMFAALQLTGVPCRFIRYPRSTGHGMSRSGPPDLRIHRLRQILAWWEARL